MKLALPSAVTRKVARTVLVGRKHSPTILFGAGVVGMVATAVTASKATLKLEGVLEETQEKMEIARTLQHEDYSEQDRKKDLTVLYVRGAGKVVKLYAPSIALGVLSIAALTGSHKILSSRNAAITAAYAALDKSFTEYRGRVTGEFGKDKDRELLYGSEIKTIVEEDSKGPKKVEQKKFAHGSSPYSKIFDEYNPNWENASEYNSLFLRAKQNYLNQLLRTRGHVFLNEVYDELSFDRTPAGSQVGWLYESVGDGYIDFGCWDDAERFHAFHVKGEGVMLDFNVDGVIWDKI